MTLIGFVLYTKIISYFQTNNMELYFFEKKQIGGSTNAHRLLPTLTLL